MVKLLILRGVPASGKSTFAKEWVLAGDQPRVRLNRDNLRWSNGIREGVGEFQQEQLISVLQKAQAREALRLGYDVVVDDTNLRAKFVKEWLKLAAEVGAEVEYMDFEITLPLALERDAQRVKSVGEDVVKSYFSRFTRNGKLGDFPVLEENVGHVFAPYVPGVRKAISFDIDGTLAHMNDRHPFDDTRYLEDTVDPNIRQLFWDAQKAGYDIIIMSGRSEDGWFDTTKWLNRNGFFPDLMLMRPSGDDRNDGIIKSEMVDEHISGVYDIVIHYDDRNRVVDALRAKGMKVAQVHPGDF